MNSFLKREIGIGVWRAPTWVVLAAVALLLLAVVGVAGSSSVVRPGSVEQNGRLITIYDSGSEKTILSQVETVGEALGEANIEVDPSDVVEPALDSQLIASSYSVNIYRSKPIIVVDGDRQTRVVTAAQSGRTIAQAANIDMYDEDITVFSRDDDILTSDGAIMRVAVVRAVPINLVLYGQPMLTRTQAKTVGEFLVEKELVINDQDYLIPSANTTISAGMEIRIWREGINTVTVDEDVDYAVEVIQSNDHYTGYREIKTPGVLGRRSVTYEIEIRGGREIKRTEIASIVLAEPKKQVEVVGIKSRVPTVPSNPGANAELGHKLMLEAGFGEDQWPCLYNLWARESGWRTEAGNPYSGAYGIPQSLPASKMGSVAADYMTNPATQIIWGLGYVSGRYGTPCGAWEFFLSRNWY